MLRASRPHEYDRGADDLLLLTNSERWVISEMLSVARISAAGGTASYFIHKCEKQGVSKEDAQALAEVLDLAVSDDLWRRGFKERKMGLQMSRRVITRRLHALDAHRIAPGLWQGAKPPLGDAVRLAGVRVLVLCAQEYQPSRNDFPGVRVIRAPNDDADRPPSVEEMTVALDAAGVVAQYVRNGARVLVTCQQGRNRSGLVTALALHRLMRFPGRECVRMVQEARPGALTNEHFVRALVRCAR